MLNLLNFSNTILSQSWLCEVPQGFFYCCFFHLKLCHVKLVLRMDGSTWHDNWVSYVMPNDILNSAISHHTLTAIHQTLFCVPSSTLPELHSVSASSSNITLNSVLALVFKIILLQKNGMEIYGDKLQFLCFESVWYQSKSVVSNIVLLFKKECYSYKTIFPTNAPFIKT